LRLVAAYYFLFSSKSTRSLRYYFRERLGYTGWKARKAIYTTYYKFGQTLIDKVAVMAGLNPRLSFDFDGEEWLHQMVQQGKGGLLLSAHVGNWEIAGHLLKRLKAPINVVMYDGEQEQIKAYLENVTGGRNMKLIIIRDDMSHIFAINQALDRNELVCMHADRFLEGNKIHSTRFLGKTANFPVGPFLLAASLQVPVSFVYAFKESTRHYHFFASQPVFYTNGNRAERLTNALQDFVTETEQKLRLYPTQWFNFYDFWKV
ncbi:lipid A biosynthesis acyltransferase, partial [Flavihumibacter sp. CACIAM 22H1]|uniref:LpxL/LpxP family acyltransferase n=1 Tax=Flavihumibacter sp. CACIAM 22H1 TaxID=1812911 RepID=UPI0007A81BA7